MTNNTGLVKATIVTGSQAFGEHSESDLNFGQYEFVTLPRKDESISIHHDRSFFQLEVCEVVYEGVASPRPNTGLAVIDDREPTVCLIVSVKRQIR